MAASQHQLPDWETPSSTTAPRRSLLGKLPFTTSSPEESLPPVQKETYPSTSYGEPPAVAPKRRFSDRIPSWLSCFGTTRKSRKLLFGAIGALVLLILIIGLAVGLTRNKGFVAFFHRRVLVQGMVILCARCRCTIPSMGLLVFFDTLLCHSCTQIDLFPSRFSLLILLDLLRICCSTKV